METSPNEEKVRFPKDSIVLLEFALQEILLKTNIFPGR